MSNDEMYDAFIDDDAQEPGQEASRVNGADIPDFEIEVEEPLEEIITDMPPVSVEEAMPVGVVMEEPALESTNDYIGSFNNQPTSGQAEFVDFRREPEDFRSIPQSSGSVVGTDGLLTAPPFEFRGGGVILPQPEVFNAYPPEVQRKIMEWTDRDIKARRDDESQRQDAILRANISRDNNKTVIPVCLVVLCILCAAITGVITQNALFVISFLVVAIVVLIVMYVNKRNSGNGNKPPQNQYTRQS